MRNIIQIDRSIIPACDVDVNRYEQIIEETQEIEKIGAYKIGASLALSVGLPKLTEIARKHTTKPLIYDHQKAGTDIPDTGGEFMKVVKESGIDAVIIFPMAGPETQSAWILAAKKVNLPIISGGHMTHVHYRFSDGGYINDDKINNMFTLSASHGIHDYVVPGNKPEVIKSIKNLLKEHKIDHPIFYAPGFIKQGGKINDAASVAGPKWHAIVGRAIYGASNIHKAALSLANCL